MLEEDELKDAILLVFANKQDQKGALGAKDVRHMIIVCIGISLENLLVRSRSPSAFQTCETVNGQSKKRVQSKLLACLKASIGW